MAHWRDDYWNGQPTTTTNNWENPPEDPFKEIKYTSETCEMNLNRLTQLITGKPNCQYLLAEIDRCKQSIVSFVTWEEQKDASGRTVYVNRKTKKLHADTPLKPGGAAHNPFRTASDLHPLPLQLQCEDPHEALHYMRRLLLE